jgi:hypothetical protein
MTSTVSLASLKGKVEVTDNLTVKKLRRLVEPDGKRGTWLRHLDDKQLVEVYHRLKLNHSLYHIIKVIQKEWGVLSGSEPRSLYRALHKFRSEVVGLFKEHEQSYPKTEEKSNFVKKEENRAIKIVKTVDGMDELAWLIILQKGRIEVMVAKEMFGTPSKLLDKSIAEFRECVNTYLVHAEALGLIDSKPKEYNLNLKTQFDGVLADVIQNDGSRITDMTTRFLDMAEKKFLVMKKLSDGSYSLDKDKEDKEDKEDV